MNRAQLTLSKAILAAKVRSSFARDGRIHLGYFSGTPSHNRDFRIVEQAIAELMDADDRIVLRVVGYVEPGDAFARHRQRLEVLPLQDFLNLQRVIGATEVNLIPLQDNVFTNCKSELKYFEAAAVGTVSVATPTHVYSRVIDDGQNGFLALAQSWDTALRTVVDTPKLEEVARAAADHAVERYSPESQAAAIRHAVLDALDVPPSRRDPAPKAAFTVPA
jgi:glycosyltransferase involved in cell wall biosynthesis